MRNCVFWDVTPCVPPKRRFLQDPHGITSQKTPFFREFEVSTSNLQVYCKEQGWEIAAAELEINKCKISIFSIYRAPSVNFEYFPNKLDYILHFFHGHNLEYIYIYYVET
jgi:hypothetical protein